jgi:hypothetical protein
MAEPTLGSSGGGLLIAAVSAAIMELIDTSIVSSGLTDLPAAPRTTN